MNALDDKFRFVYKELKKQHAFQKGNEYVFQITKSLLGESAKINFHNISCFIEMPGYKIEFENSVAFFPVKSAKELVGNGNKGLKGTREVFAEVDLVIPPFIPSGFLSELSHNLKNQPNQKSTILNDLYPIK